MRPSHFYVLTKLSQSNIKDTSGSARRVGARWNSVTLDEIASCHKLYSSLNYHHMQATRTNYWYHPQTLRRYSIYLWG